MRLRIFWCSGMHRDCDREELLLTRDVCSSRSQYVARDRGEYDIEGWVFGLRVRIKEEAG